MMRGGVRTWLALTLLAVPGWGTATAQSLPSADADAAARTVIAACVTRITDATTGLAQLEMRCPDLAAALQSAGVRPLIIGSSRDRFDRQSLLRLQSLLHPAPGAAPDVSKLEPILRSLHPQLATPRSWWQRLWDWIAGHLMGKQPRPDNSWFGDLLRQLVGARWLWLALIWCVLIAIVTAVVVVVVREVRARNARERKAASTGHSATLVGPADSRLALLRQAPLGQRPAKLFALLISRLVAAGRLPADRSLTHREVVRRARLDDPEERRFIDSLARLSERQLYSGAMTTPEGIEEVLARGEDLYTIGWGRPEEVE
jgi:hypothetical protein